MSGTERGELAARAARAYKTGLTLMQVADELGVSYGKAHALTKEGGATIRPRGHRWAPPAEGAVGDVVDHDLG